MRMPLRLALGAFFVSGAGSLLFAACTAVDSAETPSTTPAPSSSTSVAASPAIVPVTSSAPLTTTTATTTTTTVPDPTGTQSPAELIIEGTGPVYTLDEAQAFGEFGPLLWGLVTTLNGTDEIPHGPGHEWVTWGPLWAGRLPVQGPYDVYGVTDLSAVDPAAIGAVLPAGQTIVLREVRWSLDELNGFREQISAGFPDNGVCSIGSRAVNRLWVTATTPDPDVAGVPPEAVVIEVVDECPEYSFFGDDTVVP